MKHILSIVLGCASLILGVSLTSKEILLDTLYGTMAVCDPLIIDLLETDNMERLKGIDQHGLHYFRKNYPTFNRYEHSIGVYYLLNKFNTPLIEQAAGLIHDISHTTFSHLSDVIYNHDEKVLPYQDSIHHWYLETGNYKEIAERYHYTLNDFLPESEHYSALEQPLPDICADRLDYNLQTGYVFGRITKEDISRILADLSFEHPRWFFKTPSLAQRFASLSLYFTEHFWGAAWNGVIYRLMATVVQRGIKLQIIDFNDLHFTTDIAVLDKLYASDDLVIQEGLKKCSDYHLHYTHGTKEHHHHFFSSKFRGINPWVKVGNDFFRLSSLDLDFGLEYQRVKAAMREGHYLLIE